MISAYDQMRDATTSGGNALPKDDSLDVTRFRSAAAKRVQAHRARARMGLRCLTVQATSFRRGGKRDLRGSIRANAQKRFSD